jgi:hypothetical protein
MDQIWSPDLVLRELQSEPVILSNGIRARVFSNGTVVANWIQLVIGSCQIKADDFPFDNQTCHFTISSWIYNEREMEVHAGEIAYPYYVSNSGRTIVNVYNVGNKIV